MITTIDSATSPCNKNVTNGWCIFKALTDIWREMMHEKAISEVSSFKVYVPFCTELS